MNLRRPWGITIQNKLDMIFQTYLNILQANVIILYKFLYNEIYP